MSDDLAPVVDVVRRFNRSYTQRIGVLDESFLGTGHSLGAARVLYEIGADGAGVRDLRARLRLDSGYLSRLLRSLERSGAIRLTPDPADRRRRQAVLTARGRRELRRLDERSQAIATALVGDLPRRVRDELAAVLSRADEIVRLATVRFDTVDAASPDAQRAVAAYFAEIDRRFPTGFDPGDALAGDLPSYASAAGGAFLLGRSGRDTVACGGLMRIDRRTAEIKRMWVDPEWRGGGIGRRLLTALEETARSRGYRRVVLDTNASLLEAIAMYERAGYRAIARYNDNPYAAHWFEKPLTAPARRSRPQDSGAS